MTAPLLLALALAAAQATPAPGAPATPDAAPRAPRSGAKDAPSVASAPEDRPRAITLDEAVAAAVANRPSIRASREAAAGADAAAREARGALLPQVGIDAAFARSRVAPPGGATSTAEPYTGKLSGELLVWDFGQTANRWRSAKASAEAASDDARATEQGAVLEARVAYFGVLAAVALDRVAADTLANAEKHLNDTQAMVQAGTRAPIDLAQLRTQVASARATVVRTRNAIRTARTRLDVAMGAPGQPDYQVVAPALSALASEDVTTGDLFAEAVRARPELASVRATVDASAYASRAADRWFLPSLRVNAGTTGTGVYGVDPTWTTTAGVTLRWTLFDGLASNAAAQGARARVERTRAQLDDRGQQVWQQIDTAQSDVASARAQLPAAEEGVAAATDLLGLAEARYREGVGSSLELADAQLSLANAQAQRIQTEYDLASARARLLTAVGQEAWR